MTKGGRLADVGLNDGLTGTKQQEHATITIRIRNAHEFLGLRRPTGDQFGKV